MMINQTTNLSGNITLKDSTGVDTIVAYLTATLDKNSQNLNISANVVNETLLDTANAENVAGETVAQQYSTFEAAVKTKAKSLGYVIFG